jgi:hypothetical protein
MHINQDYLEHLPVLLNQWAEDIDRLVGELKPRYVFAEPASAPQNDPPPFSPPLELWAEAVDRLLAGR